MAKQEQVIVAQLPDSYKGATHVGFVINGVTSHGLYMAGRFGTVEPASGDFSPDPGLAGFQRNIEGREYLEDEGLLSRARAAATAAGASDLSAVDWRRGDVVAHLLEWGIKDGDAWYAAHQVEEEVPDA